MDWGKPLTIVRRKTETIDGMLYHPIMVSDGFKYYPIEEASMITGVSLKSLTAYCERGVGIVRRGSSRRRIHVYSVTDALTEYFRYVREDTVNALKPQ